MYHLISMKFKRLALALFVACSIRTALAQSHGTVKDTGLFFTAVPVIPHFKGGTKAFHKFLKENLKYPAQARDNALQGKVLVTFIVEKSGELSDIKIARSLSPEADKEALRVMRLSPRWLPGMQGGSYVRWRDSVSITLSISAK
jgi:TonB family protein